MSEEAIEQVAQPEASLLETPAEAAQGGSGDDFLSMIPEELRDHPSISPIKDVPNLARSFVNAQRLIGAEKLPLPANPSDADLDNIYGKLGRPESAEGYEIAPDGVIVTEDVAKSFSEAAHALRLTPDQANGILEYYRGVASTASEMSVEQENAQKASTETALRQEWGDEYQAKVSDAGKIVKEFGSVDLLGMQLADGTRVGNHPDFIRAFAKIAEFRASVTSEDTVSDSAQTSLQSRRSAQEEIQAIMHGPNYMNKKDPVARQAAIERVNELMGVLHGSE